MMKFEAGKPATVIETTDGYRQSRPPDKPIQTLTVTRVLKRYLETDDGSKWDLEGQRYPRDKRWRSRRLKLVPGTTDDLAARIRANDARTRLNALRYDSATSLSDAAAVQILEIWDRDIAEQEAARNAAAD